MADRREIDTHSATWRAVKEKCENRLAVSRATLEGRNLSERDADFERGVLDLANEILNLPNQTVAEKYREQAVEE